MILMLAGLFFLVFALIMAIAVFSFLCRQKRRRNVVKDRLQLKGSVKTASAQGRLTALILGILPISSSGLPSWAWRLAACGAWPRIRMEST